MKLPTKLTIGDDLYGIEYRTRFEDSRKTVGVCCYDTERILLKRGQVSLAHLDTAIHEILHAIVEVYKDEMDTKKLTISHPLIYFLADKLARLLADNWGIELSDG